MHQKYLTTDKQFKNLKGSISENFKPVENYRCHQILHVKYLESQPFSFLHKELVGKTMLKCEKVKNVFMEIETVICINFITS